MMATGTLWVTPCPPTAKEVQEEARAEEDVASGLVFRVNQDLEHLLLSLRRLSFCDSGDYMAIVSCLFAVFVKYIGCRTLTPLHRHSNF